MRVTFLTQWLDPEPAQFRGLPLAKALSRRGFEVEIVTGFPNYPTGQLYPGYEMRLWQRETMSGIPIVRVPLYPSHDRNPVRRTANYLSFGASAGVLGPLLARRSDALYVYHPPPTLGVPAAIFRRAWGIPVVYHIADMWPESALASGMLGRGRTRRLVGGLLDTYCKWVYSGCDEITVLSPGFAALLHERGVDPRKVHVVYNWAEDDLFRPMDRDAALADELGMTGRFNVVYAGNMGTFQALDSVLRAAQLLQGTNDVQFVFVGTGTEEARLRGMAAELGLKNVRFVGQRPIAEMPAINVLADVLLVHLQDLPFFRATIPGKTQVSMASGRPIIMAVDGDAADVVRRAGAGLTVPPESPGALAEAVKRLHDMPADERERLGAAGRTYYLKEMSLETGANRMAKLFQGLDASRLRHGQQPLKQS